MSDLAAVPAAHARPRAERGPGGRILRTVNGLLISLTNMRTGAGLGRAAAPISHCVNKSGEEPGWTRLLHSLACTRATTDEGQQD